MRTGVGMFSELDEQRMNHLVSIAETKCFSYIRDRSDAQDISQSVILEFIMNYKKIENPEAWIIGTARNKCYEFFRQKGKYRQMLGKLEAEIEITSSKSIEFFSSENSLSYEKMLSIIPENHLPKKDRELFLEYLSTGKDLKYLSNKLDLRSETLRKRLYKIRKDITAWFNIYRGVDAGRKSIIGAHLNENIINFIKQFQECYLSGNWQKIEHYLAADVVVPKNFYMPFYENVTYEVFLVEKNVYKVIIIYARGVKNASSYYFVFRLIPPHRIQVTKFPKILKKIYCIPLDNVPENVKKIFLEYSKDARQTNSSELMAELDKYGIKLEKIDTEYDKQSE